MINRAGLDPPITIIIHQTMDATISLAQIQIQVGLPEKNFQTAKEMIAQAADEGSELVLLPELWTSGYDLPNCARYSTINLELLTELKVIAAKERYQLAVRILPAPMVVSKTPLFWLPPITFSRLLTTKSILSDFLTKNNGFYPAANWLRLSSHGEKRVYRFVMTFDSRRCLENMPCLRQAVY